MTGAYQLRSATGRQIGSIGDFKGRNDSTQSTKSEFEDGGTDIAEASHRDVARRERFKSMVKGIGYKGRIRSMEGFNEGGVERGTGSPSGTLPGTVNIESGINGNEDYNATTGTMGGYGSNSIATGSGNRLGDGRITSGNGTDGMRGFDADKAIVGAYGIGEIAGFEKDSEDGLNDDDGTERLESHERFGESMGLEERLKDDGRLGYDKRMGIGGLDGRNESQF